MTENALIVMDEVNLDLAFSSKQAIDEVLAKLKAAAEAHVPDLETDAGRKAIASNSYKVSQVKTWMVKHAKAMTEDWRKKTKEVNALKSHVETFCDGLRDSTRKPLTDYEEAQKAERERKRKELEMLQDWDEAITENERIDKEREMARKIAEFERKEAERKSKEQAAREERERKDREARIAKEAAERAKREAEEAIEKAKREKELAEQREREAKEQAEKARLKAIEDAKEEKRLAVLAAEKAAKEEADRRERDRLAEIEAQKRKEEAERVAAEKKAANVKHQKKINNEALESLLALGFSEDAAKQFVSSVAKGFVKHISIQY